MRWTSVWVVTLVWRALVAAGEGAEVPRCGGGEGEDAAERCRRVGGGGGDTEHEFEVEGNKIIIEYVMDKLHVQCNGADVLWSGSLPSFPRRVRCASVRVSRCPARGAGATLARALEALNVTLALGDTQGGLTLDSLPTEPRLGARHFAGLERLAGLTVSAASRAEPEPGFLAPLRHLRELALLGVRLDPADLDDPPPNLTRLRLRDAGIRRLPEAVLALRNLDELVFTETSFAEFAVPPALRKLSLSSSNTTLRTDELRALETLMLDRWGEPRPAPLARCLELRSLQLTSPALQALPGRWLAACPHLERLVIQYARNLTALPSNLLENANALVHLAFKRGKLQALPEGLLDHVPNLRTLDLSSNHLRTLPSGVLAGPRALSALDLSYNELDGGALWEAAGLRRLASLALAGNARLGDVCRSNYSPIRFLTKLTSLFLNNTNVTRICRDWRESMPLLKTLDLRNTRISELWFEDLQYTRDVTGAEVRLEGAPITVVGFLAADFKKSLTYPATRAVVHIDSELACDCRMYWTRLALDRASHSVRVTKLRCDSGRNLMDTRADEMFCPAAEECSTAELSACSCRARPHAGATPARSHADAAPARLVVVVDCERGAWDHVPALPAAPGRLYRLRLAHNNISRLHAADLPPALQGLDLYNNSLDYVDEETATKLGRVEMLNLTDNPLDCSCSAAPLLRSLQSRPDAANELLHVTCSGGAPLAAASSAACPSLAWLAVGVLAALLAATVGTLAYFADPERRLVLKVILHRWGLLRYSAEPDDGRQFDAFVSFSHEDEEVVRALVAGLEAGPAPYRLCLHYRDWVPGRWIPDQIVQSVRQSRRTLALVSRHFLRSTWARAEFREAHALALRDSRPRLVVVLLEEPAALPLDAELSRYLRRNTYVRWGDAWFWDKLRLALPKPRPAAPPCSVYSVPVPETDSPRDVRL